MPAASAPNKAFMPAAVVGMDVIDGGVDDTPNEWSCHSSPYREQQRRWKPQEEKHGGNLCWKPTAREQLLSSITTKSSSSLSRAGSRRSHPPASPGTTGTDALAAMRGAKRPRPAGVSCTHSTGKAGTEVHGRIVPESSRQNVLSVLNDDWTPRQPLTDGRRCIGHSRSEDMSGLRDSVPGDASNEISTGMGLNAGQQEGGGSETGSGADLWVGQHGERSSEATTSAMDVTPGGREKSMGVQDDGRRLGAECGVEGTGSIQQMDYQHRRQWQQDQGGSVDDLHILYGFP